MTVSRRRHSRSRAGCALAGAALLGLSALSAACASDGLQGAKNRELSRFLAAYDRAITDRDWERVADSFLPSATVVVIGSERSEPHVQVTAEEWVDDFAAVDELGGYARTREVASIERDDATDRALVRSRVTEVAIVLDVLSEVATDEWMWIVRHGGALRIGALGLEAGRKALRPEVAARP